eukprot:SAG31_NODE_5559_length_2458_cov_3.930479_1_plen_59_part_10
MLQVLNARQSWASSTTIAAMLGLLGNLSYGVLDVHLAMAPPLIPVLSAIITERVAARNN